MSASDEHETHLMVSGRIGAVEVYRGMVVVDESEEPIAFVAGVLIAGGQTRVSHLLIGRLPPTDDYRMVPVGRLAAVLPDRIGLTMASREWDRLPRHKRE